MLRRRRFADVIQRQLALFERDERRLLEQCEVAERAYDRAGRDEAEQRYGDYADLVESAAEILADIRDHFARTLDEHTAAMYESAFNRAVAKRFPRLALEIDRN